MGPYRRPRAGRVLHDNGHSGMCVRAFFRLFLRLLYFPLAVLRPCCHRARTCCLTVPYGTRRLIGFAPLQFVPYCCLIVQSFFLFFLVTFVGRLSCPRSTSPLKTIFSSITLTAYFLSISHHQSAPHLFYFIHRLFSSSRHSMSLLSGVFLICLAGFYFFSRSFYILCIYPPTSHTL